MKLRCLLTTVLTIFMLSSKAQDPGFFPDQVMVMLHYQQDINQLTKDFNASNPGARLQVKQRLSKRLNVWLLEFDDQAIQHSKVLKDVNQHPMVAIAQYNHNNLVVRVIPNDALWSNQWDLLNDGNNGNVTDSDIDAELAWDISTGGLTVQGDTIVVAVIDGYFDLNHPDLDWWKNYAEIPNNSTDDDNNGYTDDFNGWNAFDNNDDVQSTASWQSHGTHVSGAVGAIGNNGMGVAGVNWTVKVMPVRGSSGNESTVVAAYGYVHELRATYNQTNGASGAFVVSTNSSFGVDFGQPSNYPLWCAFYDSLGAVGVISAGATINQGIDVDAQGDVPTACPSDFMMSVTNMNSSDQKVSSAGYGLNTIDIGAPGDNTWSTVHGGNYEGNSWSGTSMATPQVAGAVGLMYAAACQEMFDDFNGDPSGMAMEMRNMILSSGWDANGSLSGITVTGGRLNLKSCLDAVQMYINCSTNIEELSGGQSAFTFVYPNPASFWLELEYYISANAYLQISIVNTLGQEVMKVDKGMTFKGVNRHKLDVSQLEPGIYFMYLKMAGEVSNTTKLIKL